MSAHPLVLHAGLRNIAHLCGVVAELSSHVHAKGAGAHTEAVALRTVLPSVTNLAIKMAFMFCHIDTVQHLIAKIAFEAKFMPFGAGGDAFLGGVDGLAALGTLWTFRQLERHD